jgi:hypothetical protein
VLVVYHLFQTAVFEQNMLPRLDLVAGLAKLVGNTHHRSGGSTILHAGIAIACHANAQVHDASGLHREPQVRCHHHIGRRNTRRYLNRPAIQCKHQRSIHRAFARRQVQPACRADLHRASAIQCNLCGVIFRGYRRSAKQQRTSVRNFERSRDRGVRHAHRAD